MTLIDNDCAAKAPNAGGTLARPITTIYTLSLPFQDEEIHK